jgi:hypothetical protein
MPDRSEYRNRLLWMSSERTHAKRSSSQILTELCDTGFAQCFTSWSRDRARHWQSQRHTDEVGVLSTEALRLSAFA